VVRAAAGDDVEARAVDANEDVAREAPVRRGRGLAAVGAHDGRRVEREARGGAGAGVEDRLVAAAAAAAAVLANASQT